MINEKAGIKISAFSFYANHRTTICLSIYCLFNTPSYPTTFNRSKNRFIKLNGNGHEKI